MIDRRTALLAGAGIGSAVLVSGCGNQKRLNQNLPTSHKLREALNGFACNVEMWFSNLDFDARFDAAAALGFKHVEMWFVTMAGREAKALRALCDKAGVSMAQTVCNAPALADLSTHDQFVENTKAAIGEAQILGAPVITVTGHQNVDGVDFETSLVNYQAALERVAPLFADAKIYGAVEPFNPFNHPGHFINGHKEALQIVRDINEPYLGLNWDLFHMQRHEGNLITHLETGADKIVYMQLADSPDRHQPGTGEVNYAPVITRARELGYSGPIGLEFIPKDGNVELAAQQTRNVQSHVNYALGQK